MYPVSYYSIYSVDVCILNIVLYISRTSSSIKLNNRKQYKCLSMDDYENKLCHSPTNACIIGKFFGLVWFGLFFCKNVYYLLIQKYCGLDCYGRTSLHKTICCSFCIVFFICNNFQLFTFHCCDTDYNNHEL